MRFKALRTKSEPHEFVEIINVGGTNIVFTGNLPNPQPITATIESMEYYGIDLSGYELVEFDMFESGEVGADIRNKLTPCYNLLAVLKIYFKEKDDSQKYFLKKLIEKEMELSKKSIKHIANLL